MRKIPNQNVHAIPKRRIVHAERPHRSGSPEAFETNRRPDGFHREAHEDRIEDLTLAEAQSTQRENWDNRRCGTRRYEKKGRDVPTRYSGAAERASMLPLVLPWRSWRLDPAEREDERRIRNSTPFVEPTLEDTSGRPCRSTQRRNAQRCLD